MAHFDKQEYYYNDHVTGHVRANEFKICVTSQDALKTQAPTPSTKLTVKAPSTKTPTIGAAHTLHTSPSPWYDHMI